MEVADPADREAEDPQLLHRRTLGLGPDHLPQDVTAAGTLNRDVMKLVGRRAHPNVHTTLFSLLPQPEARGTAAAHPAEVILVEAEDRPVVNHTAVLVAHGGIDNLADAQLLHVSGDTELHQSFGVRPRHLELAERAEVHDHSLLAASPVLFNSAEVIELIRQPVTTVLDEIARVLRKAVVKGRLLGRLQVGVGSHAKSYGSREFFVAVIDANLNVGGVPAIGGIDIAGAGRGNAEEIGHLV